MSQHEPSTVAGRRLLDSLHYKGITRLDDGYFEDTTPKDAILAIETESRAYGISTLREALEKLVNAWDQDVPPAASPEWVTAQNHAVAVLGATEE